MIKYDWLLPSDFHTLEPIFQEYGGDLPDPNLSAIRVARNDEGRIVGFAVLQLIPHLEPMFIEEGYRAKVNWREFQTAIEGLFDKDRGGSYYIFPSDERIAKLCKRGGMVEVETKAWRRDL